MSDKINDGGPAFPRDYDGSFKDPFKMQYCGASLRDYFAIRALEIANNSATFTDHGVCHWTQKKQTKCEAAAEIAYQFADAMLKERGSK